MVLNNNLKTGVDTQDTSNTVSNIRGSTLEVYTDQINDKNIGLKISRNENKRGEHTFLIHHNLTNAFEITTENTFVSSTNTSSNKSILKFNTNGDNAITCDSTMNVSGNINILNNNLISTSNIYISDKYILSDNKISFDQTKLSSSGNLSGITIGDHVGNASGDITGLLTGKIVGNVTGIIGLTSPNNIYGSEITASENFKGNLSGNISGDVTGNLIGEIGTTGDSNNIITSNIIDSNNLFRGDLSGQASDVSNGIFTTSSATVFNDLSGIGSGKIITDLERTKLNDISNNANLYILPTASGDTLGGVKIGDNIIINNSGVINTDFYVGNYGLNITSDYILNINTNDLSDNILLLTGNQNISGVKTFNDTIIGNLSGNATSVTGGLTTSNTITDLSGITDMGSGKIITDDERTSINNISGVPSNVNYFVNPIATTNTSGIVQIGDNLNVTALGLLNLTRGNYNKGYGLNLSGTSFSANTNDLSDNIVLLTGNQNISGVKTFNNIIIGNLSGNATSVTGGLTTSHEITDLSDITDMGSGKIITDAERTSINNISGVPNNVNYFVNPIATTNTSGIVQIGDNLNITVGGILNASGDIYSAGSGLNLSGTTLSVNTNDLSDNVVLLTGNQNISGVKTFNNIILGNLSGNATSVTGGLTTSHAITDLSGITDTGSGKIITDAERTSINNISGVPSNANYFVNPIATTNTSGIVQIGANLNITAQGLLSKSGGSYSAGSGLNLSDTTFSVNINDLSDNMVLLSGNQNISGVKTFDNIILGNLSGNATSVTDGLTTSHEITDLSGITDTGSGKIITDAERTIINNISGVPSNSNYFVNPIATTNTSGIVQIGDNLNVTTHGLLSTSGGGSYSAGSGLNLSGTTFSVNANDLSDNTVLLSGNQNISGVKTFNNIILGNLSGNAISVTGGLTTSHEITDLSGITDMGSGKIITDAERTSINNISGVPSNANYFVNPIATTNTSGIVQIGANLNVTAQGLLSTTGGGSYSAGSGLNLSGTTFSVNANDLSDNIVFLTGNQNISGVKTFDNIILGNLSGNATSVTSGLTTSNEITDLSGITDMGSGKIITDAERTIINNISGAVYTLPIASKVKASGGHITSYTSNNLNYTVHTFMSTEQLEIHENITCDFLLVGGGGGGASRHGGGGGAGGVVIATAQSLTPNSYSVTVGSGGSGTVAANFGQASNGTDSTFYSKIAKGGGGGGGETAPFGGSPGGSGGGARGNTNTIGGSSNQDNYSSNSYVTGYGNEGGTNFGLTSNHHGGQGGGGAGAAGQNSTGDHGTTGGIGIQNDFQTNSNIYYGGGGGGSGTYTHAYSGGAGGGGIGGGGFQSATTGNNGVNGLGGGGGGGGHNGGNKNGGTGGDGVFIIRYVDNNSIGGIKLGNGFSTDASGIINISGVSVSNTATDTTLGGFKIDASSNLIITNDTLDVKLPLIYTDVRGRPTSTSNEFTIIQTIQGWQSTNSTSNVNIHSYTFNKPANCIINNYWSGRYFVTDSTSRTKTTIQLKFKIQCNGITAEDSEYYVQAWNYRESPSLSGVSYNTVSEAIKSYSGDVTVTVYIRITDPNDLTTRFELYTSHLKILLYN
jgi:hypothetical protein